MVRIHPSSSPISDATSSGVVTLTATSSVPSDSLSVGSKICKAFSCCLKRSNRIIDSYQLDTVSRTSVMPKKAWESESKSPEKELEIIHSLSKHAPVKFIGKVDQSVPMSSKNGLQRMDSHSGSEDHFEGIPSIALRSSALGLRSSAP